MPFDTLVGCRDRLNDYCRAVHQEVEGTGVTAFQIFGRLSQLRLQLSSVDPPDMDLGDATSQTWTDFHRRLERVAELEAVLRRTGVPRQHVFWGSNVRLFDPELARCVHRLAAAGNEEVHGLLTQLQDLGQALAFGEAEHMGEAWRLCDWAARVLEAPVLDQIEVGAPAWLDQDATLKVGIEAGTRTTELEERWGPTLIPEAWTQDVLSLRKELAQYQGKWWRCLSRTCWRRRGEVIGLCMPASKTNVDEQVAMLDGILETQRLRPAIEALASRGPTLFGRHWSEGNWPAMAEVYGYLKAIHADVDAGDLPVEILSFFDQKRDAVPLAAVAAAFHCRQEVALVGRPADGAQRQRRAEIASKNLVGGLDSLQVMALTKAVGRFPETVTPSSPTA